MPFQVRHGATLRCSAGRDPARLLVPEPRALQASGGRAACIDDHRPGVHVPSFGRCDAHTPSRTCTPRTPSPWVPGARGVMVAGRPVLDDASTLSCDEGGVIRVVAATPGGVAAVALP